jgi:hypothetical protein
MRPEHVLARESIQNSVDAGRPDSQKVLVRFRTARLIGAARARFTDVAYLSQLAERVKALQLQGPNFLEALSGRNALHLLFVEDYNAQGLSGEPHDKGSHFYRLLLSLGDRSKAREAKGSGGSYGFGKSVYSSSSAIQTIFAYTRFLDEKAGRSRTRIFGCGYYASHEFRGRTYSGRAWLGTGRRRDDEGRVVVDPREDRAADALAIELGFQLRGEKDLGTSILIVDSAMDLQQIVTGVEDWWWPRLVEGRLDVEAVDADGAKHHPRPRKREDLKPFIETFDIVRQRATPLNGQQKFQRLNNLGELELGSCGFTVVPLTDKGPLVPEERCNTVAMIRSPLMVVSYSSCSSTAPPVVGAYVASDGVDEYLKRAEPPAHDKWDPESGNLRDATGESKKVVEAVLSRVRSNLKRFQSEAAPPPPPRPRRLSILERALASYFTPQSTGPRPPPEGEFAPLHLHFSRPPEAFATASGKLVLRASFAVRLDEGAQEDAVDLRMDVGCPVVEDDGQDGDELRVTVVCEGVPHAHIDGSTSSLCFRLSKNERARFKVESEEYDPAWTVRLRPEIDREIAAR